MPNAFDVIIVGAGLMGSSAAKHLCKTGLRVALIGPAEPGQKANHRGVFASHYDQARITRQLDSDPDWSQLSSQSIKRYRDIEQQSGQPFYHPVGAVMAGPETGPRSDFIQNAKAVGIDHAIPYDALRGHALRDRFPYFDFPDGVLALHEKTNAGWINPRDHIKAQIQASSHLTLHSCEVIGADEKPDQAIVTCADGTTWTSPKVIIACGGFSNADNILPDPVPLTVYARTITFFEIDEAEAQRLSTMPSLVYVPPDRACEPYILPPVRYPNGKTYIKIGGDPIDIPLKSQGEIKAWFRSGGNKEVGHFLADQLVKLMPTLNYKALEFGSCVTCFTPKGLPLIYPQTDRIYALTGGNGAGAKCADELGRLASLVVTDQDWPSDLYPRPFTP